jgi:formyltetrahydrofolate deformylase
MNTHLLLIDCPDEKGLVYRITGELLRHDFNIVSNQEFVNPSSNHFFMRTVFAGNGSADEVINELDKILPAETNIQLAPTEKRPIVVMVTKEAHCLGDLLLRYAYDELPARICAVISNYDSLASLVQKFDIPFHHVSHLGREREQHEQEILSILDQYQPDYLVLAKYMRVLTPQFVAHYPKRIINIHHSFLPAFIGASPYRQAFERGVKIIGATAHIVTDDLDIGPILVQDVLHIDHSYSAADMAQAGHDVEKIVLSKALKLVLEERVFLHNNRTIIFE